MFGNYDHTVCFELGRFIHRRHFGLWGTSSWGMFWLVPHLRKSRLIVGGISLSLSLTANKKSSHPCNEPRLPPRNDLIFHRVRRGWKKQPMTSGGSVRRLAGSPTLCWQKKERWVSRCRCRNHALERRPRFRAKVVLVYWCRCADAQMFLEADEIDMHPHVGF